MPGVFDLRTYFLQQIRPLTVSAIVALALSFACVRSRPDQERLLPVIYCTDLFHPHNDPDDHFDAAAIYALTELDIRGIVLDQGERQAEAPGSIPLSQLNRITGRQIPRATGLSRKLKTPDDTGVDQPSEDQRGVALILRILRETDQPVTLISVGSLRDIAAAYNREPALFHTRVASLMLFIGEASAQTNEWNVGLDPQAFIRVMNAGLPVYWVPCFDGGNFRNNGHASFWKAAQADVLAGASDRVMNYFIYALLKKQYPDPVGFLDRPVEKADKQTIFSMKRNFWCTAVFTAAAGRTIVLDGDRYRAVAGIRASRYDDIITVFGFEPVRLHVDEQARVVYGGEEDSVRIMRFHITDRDKYARVMTSVTADLIGSLGR